MCSKRQGLVNKYSWVRSFLTMPISNIMVTKTNILPVVMETHLCSFNCSCGEHQGIRESVCVLGNFLDSSNRSKSISRVSGAMLVDSGAAPILELALPNRLRNGSNYLAILVLSSLLFPAARHPPHSPFFFVRITRR